MNLAVFVVGIVLAVLAARPLSPPVVRRLATIALVALMLIAPLISNSTSILFDALTAMCIAYGWNIIGGFTGYAAFGNVAYLGLGAFVAAGFMSRQPGHLAWPWFVGIPLSVAIVALVAGAIGMVVLRLRGHYFSIATLGVGVAMPQVITSDALFGPKGLVPNFFGGGLPLNFPLAEDISRGSLTLDADRYFFYGLGLLSALIGWAVTWRLSRSKFGYGLVAIRENEEAAEVMGINTTVCKVYAYMLSAALAALGGAVIGYKLTNMTTEADALFSTTNNLQMIIICLIGGVGTLWGPWIGAFVLFGLQEALRMASNSADFLAWEGVVFALLVVLVVLFLPRGVMLFVATRTRLTWRVFARNLVAHRV
ncbi:MAG TPA: branched-chain amino acid ABC transporter permease [Chloroflexota bacterium]|nr:branched-chain amino acid ABC transporter permease [Chloroflexota bacterium]